MKNELAPLIQSDPESLPADFREIRERILPFLVSVKASAPQQHKPWWRRTFLNSFHELSVATGFSARDALHAVRLI
jgi:hypothetical protein